jgi:hypothetical protein
MKWLGVELLIHPNLSIPCGMLLGSGSNKRTRAAWILVWNAYVWGIWKTRNKFVFRNGTAPVDEVVEYIKLQSQPGLVLLILSSIINPLIYPKLFADTIMLHRVYSSE